mgnify:CR=1 FL=1
MDVAYLSLTLNSPHLLVSRDLSRRVFYSGMNSAKTVYIHVGQLFFQTQIFRHRYSHGEGTDNKGAPLYPALGAGQRRAIRS